MQQLVQKLTSPDSHIRQNALHLLRRQVNKLMEHEFKAGELLALVENIYNRLPPRDRHEDVVQFFLHLFKLSRCETNLEEQQLRLLFPHIGIRIHQVGASSQGYKEGQALYLLEGSLEIYRKMSRNTFEACIKHNGSTYQFFHRVTRFQWFELQSSDLFQTLERSVVLFLSREVAQSIRNSHGKASAAEKVAFLKEHVFKGALDSEELESALGYYFEQHGCKMNAVLIEQGRPLDYFYVLYRGQVRISYRFKDSSGSGVGVALEDLTPGQCFGEEVTFRERDSLKGVVRYQYQAKSTTNATKVLRITRANLLRLQKDFMLLKYSWRLIIDRRLSLDSHYRAKIQEMMDLQQVQDVEALQAEPDPNDHELQLQQSKQDLRLIRQEALRERNELTYWLTKGNKNEKQFRVLLNYVRNQHGWHPEERSFIKCGRKSRLLKIGQTVKQAASPLRFLAYPRLPQNQQPRSKNSLAETTLLSRTTYNSSEQPALGLLLSHTQKFYRGVKKPLINKLKVRRVLKPGVIKVQ